ncbi:phage terminase small subunit P27 family [Catenulispora sp. NL8]|uniref:Phage terminase small subunit P27 family n=1 Tax=Catenulispora pinistramenti TaxID=2705254 RepID=A0ABS5KUC5_9ACTN|nr:phage terminase small subunit P27 family [Catenulispora pinistramenti]MBS2549641.1 phage terminase small subunit P27 family [Catenulispora pinistramenti]
MKVLEGRGTFPASEPQPAKGLPEPPADLFGEARAEWDRVAPELARMGVTTLIDRAALVVYCNAWGAYVEAVAALNDKGPLVPGREGSVVKNPAAQIVKDQAELMLKYGGRLGLNPSDRARLSVEPEYDAATDIMALISADYPNGGR